MKLGIVNSLLLVAALTAGSAFAQDVAPAPLLFGPVAGLDMGARQTRLPVYAGSFDCGEFTTGQGLRPSAGAMLAAPSLFGAHFGLAGLLTVGQASGAFSADPVEPVRVVDDLSGELVQLDRTFRLKYRELSAGVDILARYSFGGRWSLAAGPSVGYRLASSLEQSDNVSGPGNYRFPDGRSEHAMAVGGALGSGRITFGPTLLAACEIPFAGSALLQPGISFHANLASPVEDAPWREYEIGGRIAILFHAGGSPDVPPPPVAPPVKESPRPVIASAPDPVEAPAAPVSPRPRLSAALTLAGLDTDQRPVPFGRVTVNEFLYRRVAPLLPAVFFEREATGLPDRYVALTPSEAAGFSIDSLSTVDILDVQHHTLDVIGARLRRDPSARVTLAGSVSKDEPGTLAPPRAATVGGYLERVWGIDPSRITVRRGGFMERSNEATEDGRADNRRVEIASTVESITAPVLTERVARDFNPPMVAMRPTVEAEAGVKSWRLTLSQNGKVVARYAGEGAEGLDLRALRWRIADESLDAGLAPLVAELTVEDSTGATAVARTEVPMVVERKVNIVDGRIERKGNRERIGYTLVGFDFNSSELDRQNRAAIRDIASMTREGAEVTIIGYTDRIGDEQRNASLSSERAGRVADALRAALASRGIRNVTCKASGAGMETDRFTNDLPEGRVLSRGVQIVVEQNAAEDGAMSQHIDESPGF